ncbi:RraA family protein [Actinomycetospora chlora]|uniref:Putative 4-hydroxy-4-methyl-2-oxoglutarate aldolase n=1 Tax=Actinomycetospora chlora TaxID=663608 RepID=A0ABP9AWJ3_9PSEU
MEPLSAEELGRARALATSSLCDADKTLALPDPAIRAMVPDVRMVGPAVTVVAPDDHLPVLLAAAQAAPGSVLVVVNPRGARAVAGELVAAEAQRRGLAGVVIDGWCRDRAGLRRLGLPVFARGSTPASGSARDARGPDEAPVALGGVPVRPGDLVLGDDDGLAVATPDQVRAALAGAEEVERAEAAVLAGMREGRGLADSTNLADHRAARADGRDSSLAFLV